MCQGPIQDQCYKMITNKIAKGPFDLQNGQDNTLNLESII